MLHQDSAGLWRCAKLADAGKIRALLPTMQVKRWRSRQPHPGTRIIHYRCCLPALAEFANYRRGRTDGTTIETRLDHRGICSIHSAELETGGESGMILDTSLYLALRAAPPHKSAFLPTCRTDIFDFRGFDSRLNRPSKIKWRRERDSNPRSGITRLHTFQACSFNHSDTSPGPLHNASRRGAQNTGHRTGKQANRLV